MKRLKSLINLTLMLLTILLFSLSVSAELIAYDAFYDSVIDSSITVAGTEQGYLFNSVYDSSSDVVISISKSTSFGTLLFVDIFGEDVDEGHITQYFYYSPNPGFNGVDYFEFTFEQHGMISNSAKVILEISNEAPIIEQDIYYIAEGETLSGYNVLLNDSDPNDDKLYSSLVEETRFGTITLDIEGNLTYTPNEGKTGVDYYTYKITDLAKSASIENIIVIGTNYAPVANDNSYITDLDTKLVISNDTGFLSNDYDDNGDDLIVILVSDVSNGSLTINQDGSFNYTPDLGFRGLDSFTYKLTDRMLESDVATVNLFVGIPAELIAYDAFYDSVIDSSITVAGTEQGYLFNSVYDSSSDVVISISKSTSFGTLLFVDIFGEDVDEGHITQYFYYSPNPGFNGVDYFEFTFEQHGMISNSAKVILEISNEAPIIEQDIYYIAEGETLSGYNVLLNDSDPNDDKLYSSLVEETRFGTITLDIEGNLTYTPNEGKTGVDYYTYKITDLAKSASIENIIVIGTNYAPVANDNVYLIASNAILSVNSTEGFLSNDYDDNDDDLVVILESDVTNGTLVFDQDGSFNYTPNLGFEGIDVFTYKLSDRMLESEVATVKIVVGNGDNESPEFTGIPDNATIVQGNSLSAQFNATDNVGIASWEVNNSHFSISQNGLLSNATVLATGTYILNVTATDYSGNSVSVIYQVTVSQQSSQTTQQTTTTSTSTGSYRPRTTPTIVTTTPTNDTRPELIDHHERYANMATLSDDGKTKVVYEPQNTKFVPLAGTNNEASIKDNSKNASASIFAGLFTSPIYWLVLLLLILIFILLVLFVLLKIKNSNKKYSDAVA
ncbi:MAG: Ig-like domain-containing protein [Candidatus Woesearchaeota archaeon]